MAELDSVLVASGPSADLGYVEEVSLGKVPVSPALRRARRVSTTIGFTKDRFQSEEIRPDRQVTDSRTGFRRAQGDIVTELSPGSHADFMEALLGGYWQTPVAIDASDINLTATLNASTGLVEITATSFSFIAAGMFVGAPVTFTGTGTTAINGKLFTVASHAANKVILVPPVGLTFTSPASLTTGTFHVKGAKVEMGTIQRSFTFERAFSDIGKFGVFTGNRIGTMGVELPTTGIARATYGVMGVNATDLADASIDGVAEIVLDETDLTSLTFSAAAGTITAGAGSFVTAGIEPGNKIQISGTGITHEQNRNIRTVIAVTATTLTVAEAIQDSGGLYTGPFEILRVGTPAYAEASDEDVLTAVSGAILVDGVKAATVTAASFNVDNQLGSTGAIGSNFAAAISYGNQCVVSGQLTVLFSRGGAGEVLYNAYQNDADVSLVLRLDTADGTGGLSFVFPRIKVSGGQIGDADPNGLPITCDFIATKPRAANPEFGESQVAIYDTSETGVAPIVDDVLLEFVSELAGVATMRVTGGVAPYSFEPDGIGSAVAVPVAGTFTHDYVTNATYDPVITDSSTPAKTDTVEVIITTGA